MVRRRRPKGFVEDDVAALCLLEVSSRPSPPFRHQYVDMVKAGIIDPTKVVRLALIIPDTAKEKPMEGEVRL